MELERIWQDSTLKMPEADRDISVHPPQSIYSINSLGGDWLIDLLQAYRAGLEFWRARILQGSDRVPPIFRLRLYRSRTSVQQAGNAIGRECRLLLGGGGVGSARTHCRALVVPRTDALHQCGRQLTQRPTLPAHHKQRLQAGR